MIVLVIFLLDFYATQEEDIQPVYVFHVSRANKEETLYGKILEEGDRHYKILLDTPWQEGNRVRTILKSDLKEHPVIELRSEREQRLIKGWEEYFDRRGEISIGTLDKPRGVSKQIYELAKRAHMMAKKVDSNASSSPSLSNLIFDFGMVPSEAVKSSQFKTQTVLRYLGAIAITLISIWLAIMIIRSSFSFRVKNQEK